MRKWLLIAGALLVPAVLLVFVGRSGSGGTDAPTDPHAAAPRHVLLITIDTLRADRVGAYGWSQARTPVLDSLARRGVLFSRAFATAPVTLPSHASMLTGLYPPAHGARHNGVAMRDDVPGLATVLDAAGFETGAFISAFPLDRRFGLTRGFDAYDDEMPRGGDGRRQNERPGAITVDRAIAWVRSRPPDARLFLWLHLFEPHAPYGEAPPGQPSGRSASDRYDDEVAVADREVGRLLQAWPALHDTLVVATADHGEAFGEHDEIGHSIFVYDTTLQVPLLLAGPGFPAGARVETPVALVDLAPTVLGSLGRPAATLDGIDLRPVVAGQAPATRELYAETQAPLLDFGWAPLRTLRRDGVKLIDAPRPELYDLSRDPGERQNIIEARRDDARTLGERLRQISGAEFPGGANAQPSPETVARLRALGYVGSGSGASRGTRPDPKDRIAIAVRMAGVTSGELRGQAAEQALEDVLAQDPGNPQAHVRLGYVLLERGACDRAEPHFADAIAGAMPSADAHLGLAECQRRRGATGDARATLVAARGVEPGNPVVEANIGLLDLEAGRAEAAVAPLSEAVRVDPDLHAARFALARALARLGRRNEARRHAAELLTRLPAAAPQRPEVERLVRALQ